MKKIGLLTGIDPLDKTSWSGIYFKIYESLKNAGFEIEILGPYPPNKHANRIIYLIEKTLRIFSSKRYYYHGSIVGSYFKGKYFTKRLKNSDCDVVFGITSTKEFAFLKTDKPLYYFNDSSFGQISEYYSVFEDLSRLSKLEANYIEKKGLKKCTRILYPSQWAKHYVTEHYGISTQKVEVIKMGANIDFPAELNSFKSIDGKIKFLFLGVDWERKGGPIVIEVLKKLKQLAIDVELTICGCDPNIEEDFVHIIPFLNKNIESEYKELQQLLIDAHFLFVPTQAECYGIVFAEASAYGLPSISIDTGGVSSVVKNNVNGILMSRESTIDDYVNQILHLIETPDEYRRLSMNSRQYFDLELDWKIFGERMRELFSNEEKQIFLLKKKS